ncbi:coiled-coil domain-containing protein 86 [Nymphalis io]|uniref:coiled-coil domain-containing protein 86 n=1 Tax=Inachis io TaxID=171585 RepID=UPI00216A4750|nr:coiled-coil domain-containing protein 86 [Nymphalis io]
MSVATDSNVLSILEDIKKNNADETTTTSYDQKSNSTKKAINNDKNVKDLRGQPKSGRFWKTKKERFSSVIKTKGIRPDFKKKTSLRIELKRTKDLSKQLLEEIKEKELTRKERRRENIKRTEENKKKSEIVQVITNTAKLKRMKKKQLKFIEKRDTNAVNSKQ